MSAELQFGAKQAISYQPRSEMSRWCGPRENPIDDVRSTAAAALAAPLDFPPLHKAVVPGDNVVLAIEPDVPQSAEIVAAVVESVVQGGVSAEDITVLRVEGDPHASSDDPRAALPANLRDGVHLATHHPGKRGDLSYLGADQHDQPIYMSRRILDADVIIPIGSVRLDSPLGYGGVHAPLYPTFADDEARGRCLIAQNGQASDDAIPRCAKRSAARPHAPARRNGAVTQHDAEQVAWLLGVLFCVQVVPGPADSVLHLLAGRLEKVRQRGRQLGREAWEFDVPRRADLVVAAIDGGGPQQTWDNIGRAVAAAQRVVKENGMIALCTEVSETPGPALRVAAQSESVDQALRRIHKRKSPDMGVAEQWAACAAARTRLSA